MWRQSRSSTSCSVLSRLSVKPAVSAAMRPYMRSALVLEENAAKIDRKEAAKEYASRRAAYHKQVSQLRKQYASEVALQRAADEAEETAKRQEETRRKLEHQRLKNIRSAQSSLRQREKQARRQKEFQEELRVAQANRDARKARFAKARQLVIDELEEEAHLWLTTPDEVEKAFTPAAEQLLWTHPNSVLGAPTPTEDAEFWRFESHTWHMDKTYPTPRELLLEELEKMTYNETNIDSSFWTPERLAERKETEEKAQLRAMVQDVGKRNLLQKQKDMLQGRFSEREETGIPQSMPVPSVSILADTKAMEKEGVDVLLKDPTKFFEFEGGTTGDVDDDFENSASSSYSGPTLGVPKGLKDPLRYGTPQNLPYPLAIGKMPKPDTRTEREKKREEREERMIAAARAASEGDEDQANIDYAAEDSLDDGSEPLDYDKLDYDSDEEEWVKGLDPEADADIINMPRENRYKEEDVDWVVEKLEHKVEQLEEQLQFEIENAKQELRAKRESEEKERDVETATEPEETSPGAEDDEELRQLGVDVDALESVISSLTEEQIVSLYALDDLDIDTESKLREVSTLTDEQIDAMLKVEKALSESDKVREAFGVDKED